MVWPSGLARAPSAVPIVPPPPERFSTTADWPQAVCRCAARSRPITSVEPPAAAGTTRRTFSVGFQSARLDRGRIAAAERAAAPVSTRRRDNNCLGTNPLPASCFAGSVWNRTRNGKPHEAAGSVKAEQLEDRREVAHLLARRGRGAADEVED